VQQQLGIGEGGGAFALWDDDNPAWETEDEDDELAQEAMWRQDEERNNEHLSNAKAQSVLDKAISAQEVRPTNLSP
jgi:hypothetical protein